jgi:hypothetical protein
MCIGIGVQFFIEKVPIYKAPSTLFNESRHFDGGQITAEVPVSYFSN